MTEKNYLSIESTVYKINNIKNIFYQKWDFFLFYKILLIWL